MGRLIVQRQFKVFFRINYRNMPCQKFGGWRFAVFAAFALICIMTMGLGIGHAAWGKNGGTSIPLIMSSVMIGGISALGAEGVYNKQQKINQQPEEDDARRRLSDLLRDV